MTPAEFKTIRESLGLTAQWIADQAGVKLRTCQYWEAGRMAVPKDVSKFLEEIDKNIEASVAKSMALIDEMTQKLGAPPEEVTLLRYKTDQDLWRFRPDMKPLPATAHAAMLSRLRRALSTRQIPSAIEYMEPSEYLSWLDNRPDTEAERAAWAAFLRD